MADGKLTISRLSNNSSDINDHMNISVEDEKGRRLVDIKVGLAEFTESVTGLGYVPCDLITRAVYPEKVDTKQKRLDDLIDASKALVAYHYHNDNGVKPKEYHDLVKAIKNSRKPK